MRIFFINFQAQDEPTAEKLKALAYFSSPDKAFERITSNDLICLAFGGHVKWVLSQVPQNSRVHGMCFVIDGAARCDFFVEDMDNFPVTMLEMHFTRPVNTYVYKVQLGMFDPPIDIEDD